MYPCRKKNGNKELVYFNATLYSATLYVVVEGLGMSGNIIQVAAVIVSLYSIGVLLAVGQYPNGTVLLGHSSKGHRCCYGLP